MSANVSVLNPFRPKKVLIVVSNPTVSPVTSWPIGAWAAEFTHPYWEFTEHGYEVELATPKSGSQAGDRGAGGVVSSAVPGEAGLSRNNDWPSPGRHRDAALGYGSEGRQSYSQQNRTSHPSL